MDKQFSCLRISKTVQKIFMKFASCTKLSKRNDLARPEFKKINFDSVKQTQC